MAKWRQMVPNGANGIVANGLTMAYAGATVMATFRQAGIKNNLDF